MRTNLEKRDCARFNHEAPVVIEKCGTGIFHEAMMYNYCLQGMYFESDLALVPGNSAVCKNPFQRRKKRNARNLFSKHVTRFCRPRP